MSFLEKFHHVISGPSNGRKWVFLHGLMGYANNWRSIIKHFEKSDQCLAYDQRGHGKSFKPETGYNPEDYADDLYNILTELNWKKIILVGHSMGGRNALNFTSRYSDFVEKLIIEDISPQANSTNINYYQKLFDFIPTPFSSREEAKAFLMGEFVQSAITRDNPKMIADYFYANMEEKTNGLVDWRFSKSGILQSISNGHEGNRWKELENIKVPTLVIRGEKSKELSREDFNKMCNLSNLIQCIEIKNSGHWVHYEQPIEFVRVLKEFV